MNREQLDPQIQERAKRLAGTRRRLNLTQMGLSVAVWLAFLLSGLSLALREALGPPGPQTTALYILIVFVAYGIMLFPFAFYQSHVLARRYGLSRQSIRSWMADAAKGGLLSLLLGVALLVAIYWLIERYPADWWIFAALLVLLLSLVLTALAPVLLIPLFFKLKPLEDRELADRIMELAKRAGTKVKGVAVMDLSAKTSAGNAMLVGIGKTRRVVLGDTVLTGYSPDEIEVVAAHELGHHKGSDIPKLAGVQWLFTVAGLFLAAQALRWTAEPLGLEAVWDVAGLPVLFMALGAFSLLSSPITNGFTRWLETKADNFALALSGKPLAFINIMTKLSNQNLADATPSRWSEVLFWDHPPYYKRVRPAEKMLERAGQKD